MLKSIDYFAEVLPTAAATGYYTCLNACAQGYANGTRIGDSIRIQSIEINLSSQPYASAPQECVQARVLLFYDRQPNGTAPTDATLLQFTSTPEAFINSPINYVYLDRYIVLDDWRYGFGADWGGANIGIDKPVFHTAKFSCQLPVNYSSNTGTYADITLNSLWFMVCQTRSTATSSTVRCYQNCRLLYSDK